MCKHSKNIKNMFTSQRGSEVYDRIVSTIHSENMTSMIEQGLLVGFSGGPDSVFLLCFFKEYKERSNKDFSLLTIHINHSIRGDEADRDEKFSYDFSNMLGIECQSFKFDIPAMSRQLGLGVEETARNARYSCFNDIIKGRDDISYISVAHNATDNTETVLMNILRGSGISGACGIKPVRENIIRPLIKISKKEIISLLDEFSIPYVTDSTNESTDYSRNYVRNEILPLLQRLSNDPDASFAKFTDNLRLDLDYLNAEAKAFVDENNSSKITSEKLRELHPAIQAKVLSLLVFNACGEYPEEKHITALRKLLQTDNFKYSLPGKFDFICERGICSFTNKISENKISKQIFSLKKGENKISGTNLTVFVGEFDEISSNIYNFSIQAQITSDIIDDGLILRFKSDGDSYKYHGMTHKLKKVFNDRNIPPSERELIPVICDSYGIVVVPGMSERDDAKSNILSKNTSITFAFAPKQKDEIEVFTALLRK